MVIMNNLYPFFSGKKIKAHYNGVYNKLYYKTVNILYVVVVTLL